ncbi:WhiB family transcriptional regulator [Micromonospora sp. WMMC241]|uniref:WhiB family transcriptional regulator n=1 Tax=Micromonospora sp. WMMC241 TaxID=3015159 RepID=UPI0022B718CD|nr:WhiB family transcriptional regulator [Micromonospora sp. WMMC241]MCZ7434789.1 WhiB family transcriptional regulator [Micromonospora sp. WMMC241]MCZ7440844.1 WhiB family transcriptional regulator [Micromonospora sp. WMMC241]MCZ7440901.1 WhiB family transcriptional regulator [Micromonospora sp. WMMC241]
MSNYPDFLNATTAAPACRGVDTTLFFPPRGQDSTEAKAIFRRCPLLARCRLWALDQPVTELHGVWGGLSHVERIDLKRVQLRRWRGGPGEHHDQMVQMRANGATWSEIAKAIGSTTESVKSYWKRQRRVRRIAQEQVAA